MTIVARAAASRSIDRPRRRARALAALVMVALLGAACSSAPSPSIGPSGPASPATPTPAATRAGGPPCVALEPSAKALEWGGRLFYEVFVRSFADSDGDGVGDLAGLASRLDYLADLGVSGIWLMPVAEAASYHGYDVIDYTAVEADYGTEADFEALVAAAHQRDIAVIVDFVPNHTSRDHPWFVDALAGGEHRDWYVWSEADPGWPAVAGPNPWHRAASGDGFYYGAFWEGMPDLNLRNPEVTAALEAAAVTWLDRGVDGFRVDAAKHLIEDGAAHQVNTVATMDWLATFSEAAHAHDPGAIVLGEVWDARATSAGYVTGGSLDMAFDFLVGPAILSGIYNGASTLLSSQGEVATRYAPGLAGTFLSNHDQVRVMTQLRGDLAAARQAAEALLTGPGVPFLYYGEELGLTGAKPDERIRTPFPWTSESPGFGFSEGSAWEAFEPGVEAISVQSQSGVAGSLLETYRGLGRLRGAHPSLAVGSFERVRSTARELAASVRATGLERLLVIQNLSSEPVAGATLSLERGSLCGLPTARLLYPSTNAAELVSPTVTADGGFEGYIPLAELPARATLVIDLSP
jgi:glycosidase